MSLLLALLLTVADVPRLQPAEVHARMQSGDAVVVDVRGTVPYELGHIRDAVWMPLGVMQQRLSELPHEKLIVTYCTCKAEETSLEAARLLTRHGFEHVAVLQGGYPAWKDAGLPVESNREQPVTSAGGGRMAPPAAMTCKADLTSYAGVVTRYRRQRDKTVLVIDTTADTRETVTIRHRGSDDPSRFFLIHGTPLTPRDWPRIERRKGQLLPKMNAVAWVCSDGTVVVDWKPGTTLTPAI